MAAVAAAARNSTGNWIVDQLRWRAELRDEGVVSAEEFDTAEARLLGGPNTVTSLR